MAHFTRRTLLQIAVAAGLTPSAPGAASTVVVPHSTTATSKLLWASLRAQSNGPAGFVRITNSMGLPTSAAKGVFIRAASTRALVSRPLWKGRLFKTHGRPASRSLSERILPRDLASDRSVNPQDCAPVTDERHRSPTTDHLDDTEGANEPVEFERSTTQN